MKTYIIQEIVGLGYWSSIYEDFKGFLYADHYSTEEEAESITVTLNKPVTIITVYN